MIVAALALAGCGGDSDSGGGESSGFTAKTSCREWAAASGATATADKKAYLASESIDVSEGGVGEALSVWIDWLCGKDNPSTAFSPLTPVSDALAEARKQFEAGQTLPPAPADDAS
jgi:hypothetical protein